MKKLLVVCVLIACCCSFVLANDAGTIANMPKKNAAPAVSASADLEHMTFEKALIYVQDMQRLGTLDENDAIYQWLKANPKAVEPRDRNGALDEGAETCPALVIGALPYMDTGYTCDNVSDAGQNCVGAASANVIYELTPGVSGVHTVSLCGSTYDTGLAIRSGGGCPGSVLDYCNDDACGLQSQINASLTAGVTYYIVVHGYSSGCGDYTLNISAPQVTGRCCYNTGTACVDGITQSDCQQFYGSNDWLANETCQSVPCVPPPCTPDFAITAPYTGAGNTCGAGDDCYIRSGVEDQIYEVTIPYAGDWQIQLCDESVTFWDSYMCLGTTCCGSDIWCQDDGGCGPLNYYLSKFPCLTLAAGVYYLTIEGLYTGQCGGYTLDIRECPPPLGACCYGGCTPTCADLSAADCAAIGGSWAGAGTSCAANPCAGGSLRTIFVPVPTGIGVSVAVDCRGTLLYNNYGEGIIHKVDDWGVPVAPSIPMVDASGAQRNIDEWGWDESRQILWGGEQGTNAIWTVDPATGLATFQFAGCPGIPLTDGCDYDFHDGTIWHTPDVSSSICHYDLTGLLLGSLTPLDAGGSPDGSISGVEVGVGNTIYIGHNGLGYITWNDKSSGARISILAVVGGRDEGLACDAINFAPQNVLWTKGAYDGSLTALCIPDSSCLCAQLPDTCLFPYEAVDMGDLAQCNYPTLPANPGHGLSGIAWLGQCVDGEILPNILDQDLCDDGVTYYGLPWMPCTPEVVGVTVTAGPAYGRYEDCGGRLYLNGWKDGNLDGDFCDEIPCYAGFLASEWILQDVLVVPGAYFFTVLDPGVLDLGVYDGVFRWRLTHEPVGRYGYGLDVPGGPCGIGCGTYAFSYLGEVEDYIIEGGQLSVEMANYDAIGGDNSVTLRWSTASETDNDHFEIEKNGTSVAQVSGSGTTAEFHSYTWTDNDVVNGTTYTYVLYTVDVNGNRNEAGRVEATPSLTDAVVTEYALHQNFPNPFNPETNIMFDLAEAGTVKLTVVNLLGQQVAELVNGYMVSGRHTISFNATELPSGVYLYTLESNGFMAQKKMVLLK